MSAMNSCITLGIAGGTGSGKVSPIECVLNGVSAHKQFTFFGLRRIIWSHYFCFVLSKHYRNLKYIVLFFRVFIRPPWQKDCLKSSGETATQVY